LNERLIRAVFAELAERQPTGFRYIATRLEDGVSFVHVATVEGENPLATSAAFAEFVGGIGERCARWGGGDRPDAPQPTKKDVEN
jgi:hypothetical protein